MLSLRSKLSLCQFLGLQDPGFLRATLQKHEIPMRGWYPVEDVVDVVREFIFGATAGQLRSLLDEILRTQGDLRSRVSPRYRYDERWADLVRCLELDGYRVEGQNLQTVDPTIEHAAPLEDDLTTEIKRSGLPNVEGTLRVLENSADAYRRTPPDYNGCLADARVALQTLGTSIAKQRQVNHPGSFEENKWGQVLAYLRKSDFVTEEEEKALAGVFGLVSEGTHAPVGLTEQEMVRLGRSLIVGMCYFLVKRHNSGRVP
jgi:hypothetical protein